MFAPSPVLHSPGSHQCAVTTNCPFYLIFFFCILLKFLYLNTDRHEFIILASILIFFTLFYAFLFSFNIPSIYLHINIQLPYSFL